VLSGEGTGTVRRIPLHAVASPAVLVAGLALLFVTIGWWPGVLLVAAAATGTEIIVRSW
jgi:hypothetical protein